MTELIWDGKYKDGKKQGPVRIALPFQTIETVNESVQERQRSLELFSTGRETEWRNRLVWGDKKYVLPSLLPEFLGKVNLIYIDPPFDTGQDFSYMATIPENSEAEDEEETAFLKQPSILEQKAYRDTWGVTPGERERGISSLDKYLKWFYETCSLLRELLTDDGCLYVHLDWRMSHSAKLALDEIFGPDNFLNNVVWSYQTRHSSDRFWNRKHDDILLYRKTDRWTFNWRDEEVMQKLSPVTIAKYRLKDAKGLYRLNGRFLKGSPIKGAKDVDPVWEKDRPELVVRDYLRPGIPPNDSFFIPIENQSSADRTDYPTQKPTALLRKLIKASSNENDLVLDCFVGSGTTAAVAEVLGRRWIACDLSRFAIHTTRKRLLGVNAVKPFIVQNLGKYERQAWQVAEFPANGKNHSEEQRQREAAYRKFILDLYRGTQLTGHAWLHGTKAGRMVNVGAVDAPVTLADVKAIAKEAWKALATGKDAPTKAAVDILGWEFAFELNELAKQVAAESRVDVAFKKIPREVLDRKAVEQGDVRFFELGALAVESKENGREVSLKLKDFVIPTDDIPEEARKAIKHWSQLIDYWAVDWDYKNDTFHNQWQSYRTRKNPKIELEANFKYAVPGKFTVVVKVIDILGNDTTKTLEVTVQDKR
jgi:adenine-specific DNA-methyltransferase